MFIEKIKSPSNLKKIKQKDLSILCEEIRQALLQKISTKGGHAAPNLGLVELTVAMHYVFNSPTDKIVFDVSHQSYTHKMLTGRAEAFLDPAHYKDVNGFTNPKESEHDLFTIGHTSTALSLACGLAKARDLKGEKHNVIAIVGDGSLSGGQAYEGLNNISEQGTNLIIVINDNEMSIAENHGGYYKNLENLRLTNGKFKDNMFKALGFDYMYVEEGNDVATMIKAFKKVKDISKPIVLHVHTLKGKGFEFAEKNKEAFHAGSPFSLETGKHIIPANAPKSCFEISYEYLEKKMKQDSEVVVISAATPKVLSMTKDKRDLAGKQFVDVGICEEHAVAFASGIAKGGAKPIFAVYSSFIQRSYDQIHQDLSLDNNPATLLIFSASVYGMGGATHSGLYDIAELSNIPNLVYLAPTNKAEYFAMMDWAIAQKDKSVAIRVPMFMNDNDDNLEVVQTDYSEINKSQIVSLGKDVAIIAVGSMFNLAKEVADNLKAQGFAPTLINPVFVSGIDTDLLDSLQNNHSLVVTIEEGILEGGYGAKVASYLGDSNLMVKNFGLEKSFFGDYIPQELLKQNQLTTEDISAYILNHLN